MMNLFYHDRIAQGLSEIEEALKGLNYGDAANAVRALDEVRHYVNTVFELSKHTSHLWVDQLPPNWPEGHAATNPSTGLPYTYVDQWAARYELIRRDISRKLENGYTIQLVPPLGADNE